jgi:hypothetical protein
MARYDRVQIDPQGGELHASLLEAVEAANDERGLRLVGWPLRRRR